MATPLYPKSEDIAGYLTFSSLDAALKGFAEIAASVVPSGKGPTPKELKGELGTMFGDPELAGIDGSKPIVIALLGPAEQQLELVEFLDGREPTDRNFDFQ